MSLVLANTACSTRQDCEFPSKYVHRQGLEGVETVSSVAALLLGSELRCGGCGGHLGDVFNDGMLCAAPLALPRTKERQTNERQALPLGKSEGRFR